MQEILYEYQMNATTWGYLSSLIMIAVFFKFRRFWSVRNLDLIGLILFAPGLLLVLHGREMKDLAVKLSTGWQAQIRDIDQVHKAAPFREASEFGNRLPPPPGEHRQSAGGVKEVAEETRELGRQLEQRGYLWLFVVGGLFLLRLLVDSAMVRRPLLEPNLSASGLTFACAAMLIFLMSNVIAPPPTKSDAAALAKLSERFQGRVIQGELFAAIEAALAKSSEKPHVPEATDDIPQILKQRGPGYPLFHVFSSESDAPGKRATAILAHLAVVLGMVLIGYRHFDNTHTGIAAATLYLLLPYTANFTPRIDHVVPAALLVWAIQTYRRPVVAGIFVGLAAGLIWYPLFLLPLWCSFYWRRGLLRFSLAVLVVLGLVAISLLFTPSKLGPYAYQFSHTFGMMTVDPPDIRGLWEEPLSPFRWPILAAFVAMCGSMVLWPAQKNLGSLLACSAAIMLGTQFWKAYEGGTFMAWYLPLLILTIFRPNLEDRVALSAINEGWVKWRK